MPGPGIPLYAYAQPVSDGATFNNVTFAALFCLTLDGILSNVPAVPATSR